MSFCLISSRLCNLQLQLAYRITVTFTSSQSRRISTWTHTQKDNFNQSSFKFTHLQLGIPLNRHHHDQWRHGDRKRNKRNQNNRPATRRELAPDNPILRLEIPIIAQKQNQDTNTQEGRPQRLSQMPQRARLLLVIGQRGVETKELCNRNANRSEC